MQDIIIDKGAPDCDGDVMTNIVTHNDARWIKTTCKKCPLEWLTPYLSDHK